jgi:translocation and assembly module TamB
LALLLAGVLAAITIGAWLIGTESGARFALITVQDRVPGELHVDSLEGTLAGTLVLEGIDWQFDPNLWIGIDRLSVDWKPIGLLSGRWELRDIQLDGLTIALTSEPGAPVAEQEDGGGWAETVAQLAGWPFDVEGRATPIEIRLDDEAHPIERVELSAVSEFGRITVRDLLFEHALGQVEATGGVGPGARAPIDLDVRWQARPPGVPELSGSGTVRGGFQRVSLEQTIEQPVTVGVRGIVHEPLDDPLAELRAELPATDMTGLWPQLPPWRASGQAEVTAYLDGFVGIDGDLQVLASPWGAGTVRLVGHRLTEEAWRLEELIVRRGEEGPRARARGTATLPTEGLPAFTGEVSWQRFVWPLAPDQGEPLAPPTSGRARLRVGADGLTASVEEATWLRGTWRGEAAMTWTPQLTGRFRLAAADVAPQSWRPELPGRLSADVAGRGSWAEEGWRAALDIADLDGELAGRAIQGRADLGTDGQAFLAENVNVTWGGARLRGRGRVADRWNVDWELDVPNFAPWLDGARGRAELTGTLEGPRALPRGTLEGEARALAYGDFEASLLELAASVGASPGEALDVSVTANGLAGPGLAGTQGEAALELDGELTEHRLTVRAADDARRARLELAGGFAPGSGGWRDRLTSPWTGRLAGLQVTDARLGTWSLAEAATLRASPGEAQLEQACLQRDGSTVCAGGEWAADDDARWLATLAVRGLKPEHAAALMPAGLSIRSSARLTARAEGSGGEVRRVSVEAQVAAGNLTYELGEGATRVELDEGLLDVTLDDEGGEARLQLGFGELGGFRAEAQMDPPPAGAGALHEILQRPLSALGSFELQTVRPFGHLVDPVQDLEGRVSGDIELEGSLASLRPSGGFTLDRGQVSVGALGVTWEDVSATVRSADGERIALRGSARSGKGTLELEGQAQLTAEGAPSMQVRLTGEQVTLVDRPEAWVLGDPDLEVQVDPDLISVDGTVRIPEAEFRLEELPQPTVERSPDVVVVKGERVVPVSDPGMPQRLEGTIRIVLGDAVHVSGMGLTADLTGSVEVVQDPGDAIPTGDGEIRLENGMYKAYGRELELRRGQLAFLGGPIDDPTLDVIAAREARDGTVAGVRIRGRASEPDVTLWSEPEMPDEQALSYVLFGRPMDSGVAESDQGLWERAATSLGVGGGSALVKRIGEPLGLDQARIEPGDTLQEAALVLGKYLSPRLYIAYGVGLFEPVNSFQLRYILSPHWTLEAESAEGASADLLYVIERPKD